MWLSLLSLALCCTLSYGEIITIQPQEFYNGMVNGEYDLVIDTRTQEEWDTGHIENATFVPSLQLETSIPPSIQGCQGECQSIVVYCRSGNRAGVAANLLIEQGFEGTIYNGLGVNQWTDVGYELVFTDSKDAPCATDDGTDSCLDCPKKSGLCTPEPTPSPTVSAAGKTRLLGSMSLVMTAGLWMVSRI